MEKKTPLYDFHVAHGGKMVPFAGYLLPVQFPTGVIKEHNAVRTACGLFDVSHMGEVLFSGPDALANVEHLLTNRFADMDIGRVRYSPICNERGGMVDDLVVYRMAADEFLLVVNAANKDKDVAWFKAHQRGDVKVEDLSEQFAQLALQGPNARAVMEKLTDADNLPVKNYTFTKDMQVAGIHCLVSRTGYTGEAGYELYCAPEQAVALAKALLTAGVDYGLMLCGLGARDTLRLEAGMPLYGHEMSDEITPLEANLGIFVKLDKADFIGKQALIDAGEPARERIGLEVVERGIVREGSAIFADDRIVGMTTSGTMGPFVQKAIAMGLVERGVLSEGDECTVDVRGRKLRAKVVPLPFYKRSTK
ncbi:MAG TPA: glycine cleavage system aminomethyltransferase GcvT [Clostridiales bacterium]|nr:glycine cleavage system aminomethyltransferase GcvT [Clostridiales bacterium]